MANKKVIRAECQAGEFTTIPIRILHDPRLNSDAKCVLFSILSDADDFDLSYKLLQNRLKLTEDAIRKAMKNLESTGYLKRKKLQRGFHYTISEYGNLNTDSDDRATTQPEVLSERPTINDEMTIDEMVNDVVDIDVSEMKTDEEVINECMGIPKYRSFIMNINDDVMQEILEKVSILHDDCFYIDVDQIQREMDEATKGKILCFDGIIENIDSLVNDAIIEKVPVKSRRDTIKQRLLRRIEKETETYSEWPVEKVKGRIRYWAGYFFEDTNRQNIDPRHLD